VRERERERETKALEDEYGTISIVREGENSALKCYHPSLRVNWKCHANARVCSSGGDVRKVGFLSASGKYKCQRYSLLDCKCGIMRRIVGTIDREIEKFLSGRHIC
jgi:hypothetical protein